ncbi:Uncharacterized protein APZ42_027937 [Daphnia magna]|uniref:Uncharacterized protein n=1 Tax=Daphnia magna TaxID=35525 RepID=A0A164QYB0_9CRUS|nr:Uncharacterized protein APZ42_027937 [Daphnia magna]
MAASTRTVDIMEVVLIEISPLISCNFRFALPVSRMYIICCVGPLDTSMTKEKSYKFQVEGGTEKLFQCK